MALLAIFYYTFPTNKQLSELQTKCHQCKSLKVGIDDGN